MSETQTKSLDEIKFVFSVPRFLDGEITLEKGNVNIIMGRKKTLALTLMYNLINDELGSAEYYANDILDSRDFKAEMTVSVSSHGVTKTLVCNKLETENAVCNTVNDVDLNAIYFPTNVIALSKIILPIVFAEARWEKFLDAVHDALDNVNTEYPVPVDKNVVPERLTIEDDVIHIERSGIKRRYSIESDSALKLSILATLMEKGVLRDPEQTILLFDEYEAGMHPRDMLKYAYLLMLLARAMYTVVVATDSVDFVTMLTRPNGVLRTLGISDIKITRLPTLHVIFEDGRIEEYSVVSSAVPTYTSVYLDVIKKEDVFVEK